MSLSRSQISALAARLHEAQQTATAIEQVTREFPALSVTDAYAVQRALRQLRLNDGQRAVGFKAGLTSQAKMRQMGISEPSVGFLTDSMTGVEGGEIKRDELIHPRVECEIAFVLRAPLKGPGCTAEQVLEATDFVLPALEIIDSRYKNFKFDLPSVIADNSSSARLVSGGWTRRPQDFDLRTEGVSLEKNGVVVETGAGAAVLGHPAAAAAMVVNLVGQWDEAVPEGSLIMSGGITAAVAVSKGDHLQARFQHLGSISVRFV